MDGKPLEQDGSSEAASSAQEKVNVVAAGSKPSDEGGERLHDGSFTILPSTLSGA